MTAYSFHHTIAEVICVKPEIRKSRQEMLVLRNPRRQRSRNMQPPFDVRYMMSVLCDFDITARLSYHKKSRRISASQSEIRRLILYGFIWKDRFAAQHP